MLVELELLPEAVIDSEDFCLPNAFGGIALLLPSLGCCCMVKLMRERKVDDEVVKSVA